MKKILILSFLAVFLFSKEIILGVVPQQSPLKLSQKWLKITEYLEQETGLNIVFKTKNSIPMFEEELYNGNYDLAYMNPYHFIIANNKQNYNALVRSNKNIVGILVAKDKDIELTKENLKDKTFL